MTQRSHDTRWRASGPYLPTNASKAGLLEETRQFLLTYAQLGDLAATRRALVDGGLPQRARETRITIVKVIQQRLTRCAVAHAVADAFLENPVRWRDVVAIAVHLACVRELERQLGHRLKGPGRSVEQLALKIEDGMAKLSDAGAPDAAARIRQELALRLDSLAGATTVLMYQEHEYLRLTGIRAGRSVRRHLPRGLHLIFSDQRHRREDRTAGLWLEHSTPERSTEPYHWSKGIPPAYAARKKSEYFRLENAAAVRRYVEQAEL